MKATTSKKTTITVNVEIQPDGDEWPDGRDLNGYRKGTFRPSCVMLTRKIVDGTFSDRFSFGANAILKSGAIGRYVTGWLYASDVHPEWLKSAMSMARVEAEAAVRLEA